MTMQNQMISMYSEMLGLYSSAIELHLRTGKVMSNALERAAREHIAFVQSSLGQMTPVAKAEQPKDFIAAQSALFQGVRDQFATTTKNLMKIQQETGAEIKALVNEGVEKFSPEAVGKRLSKAA